MISDFKTELGGDVLKWNMRAHLSLIVENNERCPVSTNIPIQQHSCMDLPCNAYSIIGKLHQSKSIATGEWIDAGGNGGK